MCCSHTPPSLDCTASRGKTCRCPAQDACSQSAQRWAVREILTFFVVRHQILGRVNYKVRLRSQGTGHSAHLMVWGMQIDKQEFELRVRLSGSCLPAAVSPLRLQLAVPRCEAALECLSRRLWLHVVRTPHQRLQGPCHKIGYMSSKTTAAKSSRQTKDSCVP